MAQIFPSSVGFDDSTYGPSAGYGRNYGLYFGCKMTSDFQQGILHDGWSAVAQSQLGFSEPVANAVPLTANLLLTSPRAFLANRDFQEAQTVSATFQFGVVVGLLQGNYLRRCGVIARCHDAGNALNTGTPAYSWTDGYAYAAEIEGDPADPATRVKLRILRFSGGTETELSSSNLTAVTPSAPYTVSLATTTQGSDVLLEATVKGLGITGGTVVVQYTDTPPTSGLNNFTTGGKCGFYMPCSRVENSIVPNLLGAPLCKVFQVKESGVIAWRDEWRRQNANGAYSVAGLDIFTAGLGIAGQSLQSGFAWDQHTYDPDLASPITFLASAASDGEGSAIRRGSGATADRVSVEKQSTSQRQDYIMLSQIPPASLTHQRQAVTVDFRQSGTPDGFYAAGIALRCSQPLPRTNPNSGGSLANATMYLFTCRVLNSSTVQFDLTRVVNGSSVNLGTLQDTVSGGTYFPGFATEFEMDAEVYDDTANQYTTSGSAFLRLRVDGVVVPLSNADSDGLIQATGSNFIESGGVGMYYDNQATTNDPREITFNGWTSREPAVAPFVDPEDQLSIDVAAEDSLYGDGSSVFGNLHTVLPADFSWEEEELNQPEQLLTENERMITYVTAVKSDLSPYSRKAWRFRGIADAAQNQALYNFMETHIGAQNGFFWQPFAGGETYRCCLADGTIELLQQFKDRVPVEFRIIELP